MRGVGIVDFLSESALEILVLLGLSRDEESDQLTLFGKLQMSGLRAFEDADTQKALKLSDDQKEKIKTIREDHEKEVRDLFKGGFDPSKAEENMKKMASLNKEGMERAAATLNADQKKTWEELTGKPFEYRLDGEVATINVTPLQGRPSSYQIRMER